MTPPRWASPARRAEVAEGSNAVFTVTLSKAIAKETTVAWSTPQATDTATAADLGAISGAVTFTAGSSVGARPRPSASPSPTTRWRSPRRPSPSALGAVGGDIAGLVTVDLERFQRHGHHYKPYLSPRTVSVSGPATVMERDSAIYTIYLSPVGSVPSCRFDGGLRHFRWVGSLSGAGCGGGELDYTARSPER